jgi:hypothetical protein
MKNKQWTSFVLMGDKNFFDIILVNTKNINKHYPKALITVYDRWFTNEQINIIKKEEYIRYIKWNLRYIDVNIEFFANSFKERLLVLYKNFFNFFSFANTVKYIKKEILLTNKVFCYQHYINHYWWKFIFLDWDAILVKPFDFSKYQKFDIWVTLRRLDEIINKEWNCQVLNSWVLFFLWNDLQNKIFIESWIKELHITHEYLIEQTSLTRLIEKINNNAFHSYNTLSIIKKWNDIVKIVTLPCEEFNYNWIDQHFVYKEHIAVLHFKWWRHISANFQSLIKNLDLPVSYH